MHDKAYIGRRLVLAWLALCWERLWPALWPATAVAAGFVAVALTDMLPALPGWLHAILLLGALAAFGFLLWRGLRGLRLPDFPLAQRRVERVSELPHRPLTAIEDTLSSERDSAAQILWQTHQRRMRETVARLKVGLPHPGLAIRDRFATRAVVFLALIIGLAVGIGDGTDRLARAVTPDFSGPAPVAAEIDVWINPPAYTRIAPTQLPPQGSDSVVHVPVGSTVLARVFGGDAQPVLKVDEATQPFETVDALNHELSRELTEGQRLSVSQGEAELAAWPISLVPDLPPEIALSEELSVTLRNALKIDYEAADDYGLASVRAEIRLRDSENDEVLALDMPLPGIGLQTATDTAFHDLTPHPWAGLPVTMELIATDGIEQDGYSEQIDFVLPERTFNHPVAKAIIEQRKELSRAPERRRIIALALAGIASGPETYDEDVVVYLSLNSAVSRLRRSGEKQDIASVQDLLWDTALRIEDGKVSLAERALRDAQQALMDALARDADDAEIERLMDELSRALQEYLQAMAEQAMRQAQNGQQPQEMDPNSQMVESQDLQDMIERARELSRMGAKDAAREMLRQLQEMLENMRNGQMMAMPQQMQGAERAMRELNDLMRQQQRLLDETFRQSQQGQQQGQRGQQQQGQRGQMPQMGQRGQMPQPGQRGQQPGQQQFGQQGQPMPGMSAEQEALRRQLFDIMRQMGESLGDIPRPFGRAEQAMRDSRDALQQGQASPSAEAQTRALDQLAEGMRSLAEEMAQQFGNAQQNGEQMGVTDEDPLGRNNPQGGLNTSDVAIPEEADLQRAREILDELRRRAADRTRPPAEHDYIDRLLEQF